MTQYVLGIDSGGTRYRVKAFGLDGSLLAEHVGESAVHFKFARDEVLRRINGHLDRCLEGFGGQRSDCVQIVCGSAGIDSPGDADEVTAIYASLPGFSCPVACVNDAEVAQYAATGGVGVVVIAGTGSCAFGRNGHGQTARSGGWPISMFGDEGSGTWICLKAFQHMGLWFDGRVPSSALSDRLRALLRLDDAAALKRLCIQVEHLTWIDPGVAETVDETAEAGDPFAQVIIEQAAELTFALGDAVVRRLDLDREERFRVGAWGSALTKSRRHFEAFKRAFEARYSNVDVVISEMDAATGACRMALALVGVEGTPSTL